MWLQRGSWVICPLLGAGLGWGLITVARWALSLPWVPFQGPLELIDSVPQPWRALGAIALGAVAGLVFAGYWAQDRLTVAVHDDRVELTRAGQTRKVPREPVRAVFLDGKQLGMVDVDGCELAREKSDLDGGRLRAAFTGHGYPWTENDPYADAYRMWVEDDPDLQPAANAMLKARRKALKSNDEESDVAELRRELVKLGVVVRDERNRQYWRRVGH